MEYSDEFQHFWSFYPRKVGKPEAYRAWKRAMKSYPAHVLIDAIQVYTQRWDTVGTPQLYIPHATTWINQERFNDDPTIAVPERTGNRNETGQTAAAGLRAALADLNRMGQRQAGSDLDLSEEADF